MDSSSSSESSLGEDRSSSESGSYRWRSSRKNKKGKSIKSGVKAKSHKIQLKTSELCAQAVLDEEHCPGTHTLENLTFEQLVAGELEICTMRDVSKKEKFARLRILKLLAYFANILPQKTLIKVYKAVILKVEKGIFNWSAELVEKTENMLDRAVSKIKISRDRDRIKVDRTLDKNVTEKQKTRKEPGLVAKNVERVVYCADFNKNRCDKENNHEGKFMGKDVIKVHMCHNCLTIDKEKRFHPEGDDKCPHKTA